MRVQLFTDYITGNMSVFVFEDGPSSIGYYSTKDGKVFTFHDMGEPPTPFLILPQSMSRVFMKAIVEELDRIGVKPEEDSVNKGRLQATQLHLTDMQKIMKDLFDMNKSVLNIVASNCPPAAIQLNQPSPTLKELGLWTDNDMEDFARHVMFEYKEAAAGGVIKINMSELLKNYKNEIKK
jgi:hypothetical protein